MKKKLFSFFNKHRKENLEKNISDDESTETKNIIDNDLVIKIIKGLGEIDNIENIESCATRLRISVKNPELINKDILLGTGAIEIIKHEDNVHIIYGPKVSDIKPKLKEVCKK